MDRLEKLKTLLEESPSDSFLLFALAKEYEKLEDYEQSKLHFLNLVKIDPNYVGTYYHLAKLYEKLEEEELALETYSTGMEIASKMDEIHAFKELKQAKMNLEFTM